jgi:hypothetical protein
MASIKPTASNPTAIMTNPQKASPLATRVGFDALSALCASTLVAPLICLIDKSIIQKTHMQGTIQSILMTNIRTAVRHPIAYLTSVPYLLINTLYFSTYTTANVTDTIMAHRASKPASTVSPGPAKFLATSATNLSVCLYKDARFAGFFGAAATATTAAGANVAKRAVPKTTLALFAARDMLTIFASFNIPPILGPALGSMSAAQFIAPASVQLISTPMHLLGLDLYNRPYQAAKGPSGAERWNVVKRDWLGASFARMGRIVPAFGVGGVVNAKLRKTLMGSLE